MIENRMLSAILGSRSPKRSCTASARGSSTSGLRPAERGRAWPGGARLPLRRHQAAQALDWTVRDCLVPGKNGEAIRKGQVFDREKFEDMKSELYALRGWDVATGRRPGPGWWRWVCPKWPTTWGPRAGRVAGRADRRPPAARRACQGLQGRHGVDVQFLQLVEDRRLLAEKRVAAGGGRPASLPGLHGPALRPPCSSVGEHLLGPVRSPPAAARPAGPRGCRSSCPRRRARSCAGRRPRPPSSLTATLKFFTRGRMLGQLGQLVVVRGEERLGARAAGGCGCTPPPPRRWTGRRRCWCRARSRRG